MARRDHRGTPYSDAVLSTPGLLSYWRLGERSGTVARDETGVSAGTYTAAPTLGVPGAIADGGTGITGNGTTQFASTAGGLARFNLGDIVTVEAWVKPGASGAARGILAKGVGTYFLRLTTTNAIEFLKSQTASIVTSTVVVPAGWHHVAVTKNGAAVKLYLDAVDVTGTVVNATLADAANAVTIGVDSGAAANFFNGSLAEVAVYNRALAAGEIQNHYAAAR